MDSIYEICSQSESNRDTVAFDEIVCSLFVSHHSMNLLSGISPDIAVNSELLKQDVLPYKLTLESNVQCANIDSMSSVEYVYRSVKTLSLRTKDFQRDPTIEFHVRMFNKGEEVLQDACNMASELSKSKKNITTSTLDQDRYFTWN